MRIAYVCRALDDSKPVVAAQMGWIRSLAGKPSVEHLYVVAPRVTGVDFPANVSIHPFPGRGWPRRIPAFYRAVLGIPGRVDAFFVAQGGPYPALLLPWKIAARRPVYQWKAHPHISRRMHFYARWCDNLVFTATPGSLPLSLPNVRVVGHGIDTHLFTPTDTPTDRDLITIGRVAPIKRLDAMIRAVATAGRDLGRTPTLDVYGPCSGDEKPHLASLEALADELGLGHSVRFCGAVSQAELATVLPRYRASVNFSDTALDKAAGESMAAGVPVITTNPRAAEVFPPDLRDVLTARADHPEEEAARLVAALSWDEATRRSIGGRLRDAVVEGHSLDALFDKVLAAAAVERGARR